MPFPTDDYTPHGYLDTPTHTRNLTPRGVLRSWGAGFRWHYPAHAGMYGGHRETYRAGVRIAVDGALELAEFDRATSPYHSRNIMSFDLVRGAATAHIAYHLVGEHALRAVLVPRGADHITLHVEYTRLLAARGEWGESGLIGRVGDGLLVLQGFEDGEAFVLWSSQPLAWLGITTDAGEEAQWAGWPDRGQAANSPSHTPGAAPLLLDGALLAAAADDQFVAVTGRRGDTVALHAVLGIDRLNRELHASTVEIIFARGKTAAEARHHLGQARRSAAADWAAKTADDDSFWARAPRLEGDWPAHWRRGLVYDMETLRMMVRPPIGIYRHVWDAMQIQAPRVVLAEAAMDALLLAYADPQLAQEVLLGTFLDAPGPQVPCSREDGSYNMVAADGTVCGTAPSWGYPWLVLEWLDGLHPNRQWLEQLYPRLAEYLDWWLTHRRDADGWLFYACSWEAGQDDSPRFGAQPLGGGHPARHVRPVDLHAALAHASGVMARFAGQLNRSDDRARWAALARAFQARTSQLWHDTGHPVPGGRYADFDRQAGAFTDVDDLMLLAPVALGVAAGEHVMALRPAIQAIQPEHLTWPPPTWTAIEAALTAGLPTSAAELAAAVCNRVYHFWDARAAHPERTLPGISCEYWPSHGRCGGEGYGWGAFTTHLVLHTLAGITPTRACLRLRPNLPPAWRAAGRRFVVQMHLRQPLTIALEPLSAERVAVTLNTQRDEITWGQALTYPWEEL